MQKAGRREDEAYLNLYSINPAVGKFSCFLDENFHLWAMKYGKGASCITGLIKQNNLKDTELVWWPRVKVTQVFKEPLHSEDFWSLSCAPLLILTPGYPLRTSWPWRSAQTDGRRGSWQEAGKPSVKHQDGSPSPSWHLRTGRQKTEKWLLANRQSWTL